MKEFCFLVICTITLLSCSKDGDPAPQMLINANMEIGEVRPNSWWQRSNGHYQNIWTTDVAASSSHALEIFSPLLDSDTTHFSYWAQTFEGVIPFGKDIVFSIKIKGKDLAGKGVSINMMGYDTVLPVVGSTIIQSAINDDILGGKTTFDWTTYSVTIKNLESSVRNVTVYLVLETNTSGTVYFDDASLHTN